MQSHDRSHDPAMNVHDSSHDPRKIQHAQKPEDVDKVHAKIDMIMLKSSRSKVLQHVELTCGTSPREHHCRRYEKKYCLKCMCIVKRATVSYNCHYLKESSVCPLQYTCRSHSITLHMLETLQCFGSIYKALTVNLF